MAKQSIVIKVLIIACFMLALASATHAQATRTWVSGVGDDVNPCSRTAPCKTFAGAISKTAPGGEISVLDPGGFGAVTITKAITLNGTGTLASILASTTNGIIVNAGSGDTIIIRDISINGATSGINGIRFLAGKTLMVDHCWIYGFSGSGANSNGIDVALTNSGNLKVIDTVIENISGPGIHMTTTAGQVVATIEHDRIMNCGNGIEAVDNVRAAITNSTLTHDNIAILTSGTGSILNIDDVLVTYGAAGLQASSGSTLNVSDSIIAQNLTGINLNGGTINSFQGNSVFSNPTPGAFSSTTAKQ